MMSAAGDFAGACPRVAHLRSLGVEIEVPDDSKVIMFQMGTANEQVVYDDLTKTASSDEVILRETEIPIEWFTSNGTKVTGRPDMVVCQRQQGPSRDVPLFGIEIKGVFSVWTSREVLFDGAPKLTNLLQAAHYSWKLGVPFRLMYKQYSNQAVPGWAGKMFPKQGEPNSEHIEYNEKGDIKYIRPFEIVYELEWYSAPISKDEKESSSSKSKKLRYRRESSVGESPGDWVRTLVSQADIERFYERVSKLPTEGLGKRPLTIDALGNEKSYSNCGYCPLKSVCDTHEKSGYEVWLVMVQQHLQGEST